MLHYLLTWGCRRGARQVAAGVALLVLLTMAVAVVCGTLVGVAVSVMGRAIRHVVLLRVRGNSRCEACSSS